MFCRKQNLRVSQTSFLATETFCFGDSAVIMALSDNVIWCCTLHLVWKNSIILGFMTKVYYSQSNSWRQWQCCIRWGLILLRFPVVAINKKEREEKQFFLKLYRTREEKEQWKHFCGWGVYWLESGDTICIIVHEQRYNILWYTQYYRHDNNTVYQYFPTPHSNTNVSWKCEKYLCGIFQYIR